VNNDYPNKI